jgi:hypothetical protein
MVALEIVSGRRIKRVTATLLKIAPQPRRTPGISFSSALAINLARTTEKERLKKVAV